MMDDAASAACETEYTGNCDAMAEAMAARLEGLAPLNLSKMHINEEEPQISTTSWNQP